MPEERLLIKHSCFPFESETSLVSSAPAWQPEICHTAKPTLPCQPENPCCRVRAGRLSMSMLTFARKAYMVHSKNRGKLKRYFIWPRILSTFVSVGTLLSCLQAANDRSHWYVHLYTTPACKSVSGKYFRNKDMGTVKPNNSFTFAF